MSPRRPNCGLAGSKYHVYEGGIRIPFLLRWPERFAPAVRDDVMLHFTDVFETLASACQLQSPRDIKPDGRDAYAILAGDSVADTPTRFWQWNRYIPAMRCNAAMREGDWKLVWPGVPGFLNVSDEDMAAGRELRSLRLEMPETITPPPDLGLVQEAGPELYNVREDPGETNNLADQHRNRANRMVDALDDWMVEVYGDFHSILKKRFPTAS